LLIDTHYWTPVATLDQLRALDPLLPGELVARVAEAVQERLGGRDGVFLCHNHCVWGGQPLREGLAEVQSFLVENPDEVVTLLVQDETASPDNVAVFAEAGLEEYVYVHEGGPDGDWPTLAEMIDSGDRLVVLAENEGPPPAWYHSAFTYVQDTPFGFATPEEMSCDPNRGTSDAPLFLLNHWVSLIAPDRRSATTVNAFDFVVDRASRCKAARGQLPNFVAVDFYGIGEVFAAVETLNDSDR